MIISQLLKWEKFTHPLFNHNMAKILKARLNTKNFKYKRSETGNFIAKPKKLNDAVKKPNTYTEKSPTRVDFMFKLLRK